MKVLKKPSHSGFSGSIFPRKSGQLMVDVKHHTCVYIYIHIYICMYMYIYIHIRVKSLNWWVLQEGYSII